MLICNQLVIRELLYNSEKKIKWTVKKKYEVFYKVAPVENPIYVLN